MIRGREEKVDRTKEGGEKREREKKEKKREEGSRRKKNAARSFLFVLYQLTIIFVSRRFDSWREGRGMVE